MQLLLNAIASAAILAPAAIGFTLIFTLFRYTNFAVGALMTTGAFAAWGMNELGLPIWMGGVFAVVFGAGLLLASDRIVFEPLRGRSGGTLLLVSIALSVIIDNVIRFAFGTQIRAFDLPLRPPLTFAGLRFTPETLWVIGISILATLAVGALLAFTRLGRALRAVADNASLASIRGLPVPRIEAAGILLAGALFGLSGTLAGLDLAIEPNLSLALAIPVIAAAIVGGLGSPLGAALGAVIIGLAEELTVAFISAPYKGAVGFVVIALVLLIRPQGLLGRPVERK
ncbi:branched-chain amino acid ABC transporter permease [Tropicimonas sediminicola]|uniref:Branched-chain amino acid transport system permease protein/neutral amino acid transport system permease protein n=1 Tax=Tropicimonas sediminicola TaxID=1031541 RepID=A0A239MFI4_9RHOB|nr:branched-chain amino acid ABC transporter permease [Tropicimonas sediminicola]SNT40738.1 branched-chain amino acid transport system permease protein/neutral amino acid transport system permease protein [Tropicimonas sediminicola]